MAINFLKFFSSMLNLSTLDNNKKITSWTSTRIFTEKIKPFGVDNA